MTSPLEERLEEFLHQREVLKELRMTVVAGKKSLVIPFDKIIEYDLELAKSLLDRPADFLKRADEMLDGITKIPGMHLRVRDLDKSIKPDEIRAWDIDHFVQIKGTVAGAGKPKFLKVGEYEPGIYEFRDYQRVWIDGLDTDLMDDLVGTVRGGNKVVATGILKATPTQIPEQFEKLLEANYIVIPEKEVCEEKIGVWDGTGCVMGREECEAKGGTWDGERYCIFEVA